MRREKWEREKREIEGETGGEREDVHQTFTNSQPQDLTHSKV